MTTPSPNPEELEQWAHQLPGGYVYEAGFGTHIMVEIEASALRDLISHREALAEKRGREAKRTQVKAAWDGLKIRGGASAGTARGIITENQFGEKFDMQVDRDAYREFMRALTEDQS